MSYSQESILSCSKRGSLKKSTDYQRRTPKIRAKKRSFLEDSLTPSFLQKDSGLKENDTTSQLLYDDEHLFSDTQADSDTLLFDKIVVGKSKTKKIQKKKQEKKQVLKSQYKSVKTKSKTTNFNIMRFQENTRKLRKKTYRFYCFDEKDLNLKEEFKNKDIPQHQSDNDKQSDDDTISHAIKQCTQSLKEAIENERQENKIDEQQQQEQQNKNNNNKQEFDFDLDSNENEGIERENSYSSFDLTSETEYEQYKNLQQSKISSKKNSKIRQKKHSENESDAFMQGIFSTGSSSDSSDFSSDSSDSEQNENKNVLVNKKGNLFKNNLLCTVSKRSSCRSLRSSQLSQ
ncbi:hypothetical protein PPERSA_08970 [Pseudocohnilembus persalinus]|uniref:Uncharacterized protein n=1 Tax=Pseudocohnilembus persalinus TaxID=266149 RepID=A0A0V0R2Y0_PSEPJ|nr:hypothetical protein PPERSA_08970 [Pseudocohnilembus persalinus]|eukprot:KRX08866.1 hypothetical protein PPERSA_08970 [Pseudocohnilembus persalinus]